MEASRRRLGVELQPGCARIAVTRLADAAGVEQPGAATQLEQGVVARLGTAGVVPGAAVGTAEEERHVRVADQPDAARVGVDAGVGLLAGEHVLPDRVARRGVEEADLTALALRLELAQELQRLLADVCPRPLDRQGGRLGEGVDIERPQHREVVVADQRDRAALAHEGGAGIGLDPVAEHVAEAPDLLGAGLLDRLEHGFQRGQIGVDVGNCGDPHAGQRTQWPARR